MENITIQKSRSTPSVTLDQLNNIISFDGPSYPENAHAFYKPIFEWIKEYLNNIDKNTTTTVNLNLSYINTSSSKYIFTILQMFEASYNHGNHIKINWYYDLEDEVEYENIKDYQYELIIPINVIGINRTENEQS